MAIAANNTIVKAIKTFQGGEGFKTPASAPFEVSRQRFAELRANGLVTEFIDAGEKVAPKPSNKSAAKPDNK